jgi:predicted nucleotide-binding protein (sugar kinase/HSP70/actin superfamily)
MSGSLINYLRTKEAGGSPRDDICTRYVYFTTNSTGPCRLGFYEQEFRNVLANAGYGGLRVIAFSDTVAMHAGEKEEGLPFDIRFYSDIFSAVMLGDILTDLCNRTRAYEHLKGATACAYETSVTKAEERLARPAHFSKLVERYLPRTMRTALDVGWRTLLWLVDPRFLSATLRIRRAFKEVRVNRLTVKPCVKLIGEFWAQTTQGDGNFRAHTFLEAQGAEVVAEPVSTWFLYLLFQAEQKARSRISVRFHYPKETLADRLDAAGFILRTSFMIIGFRAAELMYRGKYNLMRLLLNGLPDSLPHMRTFARIAGRYYNPLLYGGESHMEIAKTLYYTGCNRVHAVFSLKPFGCMPSGMSDGVQPWVRAEHPGTLFLSVETSGEGTTNAQSRMLMVLSEARERARQEYRDALASSGLSVRTVEPLTQATHALSRLPRRPVYVALAAQTVREYARRTLRGFRSHS